MQLEPVRQEVARNGAARKSLSSFAEWPPVRVHEIPARLSRLLRQKRELKVEGATLPGGDSVRGIRRAGCAHMPVCGKCRRLSFSEFHQILREFKHIRRFRES